MTENQPIAPASKISQILLSAGVIVVVLVFLFGQFEYTLPVISMNISSLNHWIMDDTTRSRLRQKKESQIAREKSNQNYISPQISSRITMETNFGRLNIGLFDSVAPKTADNFVKLAEKGYYNNMNFHRIVKVEGFNVLQGGDPTGTGSGGESASGKEFEDEIYKNRDSREFVYPKLYGEITPGGLALYRKGYLAMANRGTDTNSSQFFVMLTDVDQLAPAYTIFGKVDEADFSVLDKIYSEVNPGSDGVKPDKEVKIIKTERKK